MGPWVSPNVIVNVVSTCQRALKSWKSVSSVQRDTTKESSTKRHKAKNHQERCKDTFWQRTILVLRARQAACPLPVVDNQGFAACTATAKTHGAAEMPLALSPCGCRTDLAQPTTTRGNEAMWRGLLRGRHILDRRGASF